MQKPIEQLKLRTFTPKTSKTHQKQGCGCHSFAPPFFGGKSITGFDPRLFGPWDGCLTIVVKVVHKPRLLPPVAFSRWRGLASCKGSFLSEVFTLEMALWRFLWGGVGRGPLWTGPVSIPKSNPPCLPPTITPVHRQPGPGSGGPRRPVPRWGRRHPRVHSTSEPRRHRVCRLRTRNCRSPNVSDTMHR